MFKRQRTGSVVCASCGSLVGVNDDKCYNCGRRNPGLWGFGPMLRTFGNDLGFVALVVYGCTILYGLGLLLTVLLGGDIMGGGSPLSILSPNTMVLFILGASGYEPVFRFGRWWTILSAGWLHAGVLHIFFNLLWIRQLGPATADIYGPGRMVIIYTIAGACGFLLTTLAAFFLGWMPIPFLRGSPLTVGASAPVFGLLGALVYYGRRGGSSMIRSEAMGYATTLFVMGFIIPGVDNYAHAGGFLGGYLTSLWLDPLKPERMDHLVLAAVCLILTALSIIASLVTALPLLGL
jgi:membrane associated rhomboid family serine protease